MPGLRLPAGSELVTVEKLRPDERAIVAALHLHPHQFWFVASNAESLAHADADPACVPLIVRAKGEAVGFAMYGPDRDDGNYWVHRLMIDARLQGRGYGSTALARILEIIAALPHAGCAMLGVSPSNNRARSLYKRMGFHDTGDVIDGDVVMKHVY